jgi:hypothetical protein
MLRFKTLNPPEKCYPFSWKISTEQHHFSKMDIERNRGERKKERKKEKELRDVHMCYNIILP